MQDCGSNNPRPQPPTGCRTACCVSPRQTFQKDFLCRPNAVCAAFPHKISDDLFTQIRQLIVAQRRQNASNILQISLVCGVRQLLRSYISYPVFNVLCQRYASIDGFRRMLNLTLKQNCLFLYPLSACLGVYSLGGLTVSVQISLGFPRSHTHGILQSSNCYCRAF